MMERLSTTPNKLHPSFPGDPADPYYFKLSKHQELSTEWEKTEATLSNLLNEYLIPEHGPGDDDDGLKFINYGNTEEVFLYEPTNGNQPAVVLIGQPITSCAEIRREYECTKYFSNVNPEHIMKPLHYFDDVANDRAGYVMPYIDRARCICADYDADTGLGDEFGVWVPDPKYHYAKFTPETTDAIHANMIAILVASYDNKDQLGIAATQINGNDFVFDADYDIENCPTDTMLEHMQLLTVRDSVSCLFSEYLQLITEEFSVATGLTPDQAKHPTMKVNHWSAKALPKEVIEEGIEKGIERMMDNMKTSYTYAKMDDI